MTDPRRAHEQAIEVHLRAAKLHERAAVHWEDMGYEETADAERRKAAKELEAAEAQRARRPFAASAD
jgi:hypothetical protein